MNRGFIIMDQGGKPDEPVPIKVWPHPQLISELPQHFWDREGILLLDWLPEKTTIYSGYYIEELINCVKRLNEKGEGS